MRIGNMYHLFTLLLLSVFAIHFFFTTSVYSQSLVTPFSENELRNCITISANQVQNISINDSSIDFELPMTCFEFIEKQVNLNDIFAGDNVVLITPVNEDFPNNTYSIDPTGSRLLVNVDLVNNTVEALEIAVQVVFTDKEITGQLYNFSHLITSFSVQNEGDEDEAEDQTSVAQTFGAPTEADIRVCLRVEDDSALQLTQIQNLENGRSVISFQINMTNCTALAFEGTTLSEILDSNDDSVDFFLTVDGRNVTSETYTINESTILVSNAFINTDAFEGEAQGIPPIQLRVEFTDRNVDGRILNLTETIISTSRQTTQENVDVNERQGVEACGSDQACRNCINSGGLWLAIGCVDPTPVGILTRLIQLGLGVMGGVALVQIIYAGIIYQTGQQEKIAQAREQIFSTLTGVAVLVFSVLILQIIGVNILDVVPAGLI